MMSAGQLISPSLAGDVIAIHQAAEREQRVLPLDQRPLGEPGRVVHRAVGRAENDRGHHVLDRGRAMLEPDPLELLEAGRDRRILAAGLAVDEHERAHPVRRQQRGPQAEDPPCDIPPSTAWSIPR